MMSTVPPFERVVRDHGPTVLRVCRAVLGRHADADDAWSETFLAALRAWPDLPESTNVEAWLVRVAHRKAIDVTRARARRAVPIAEPALVGATDGATGAGDPATVDHDLWPAVARLPERQRLAVAYHYLGGLPHPQVAQLIGGTPASVRRAASDGVRALRRAGLHTTDSTPRGRA